MIPPTKSNLQPQFAKVGALELDKFVEIMHAITVAHGMSPYSELAPVQFIILYQRQLL